MSNMTYTTSARTGQGITFPDCKIVKGWVGEVRRGGALVTSGPLVKTKESAERWATSEAARYRAHRQQHGEGIEDAQKRRSALRAAEQRRNSRIYKKSGEMYELIQAMASDAELVSEWLPPQALARLAKVRELVTFAETDVAR